MSPGSGAAAEEIQLQLHAIMVSAQYQGHINPFVNLALALASKGITVTFVHFQHVHQMLSRAHHATDDADIFGEARAAGLDIRYETISDGFPLDFDRDHNFHEYAQELVVKFPLIAEEFVGKKLKQFGSGWRNFVVFDTLYFWNTGIAKKYNIVSVSLWTQPALLFNILYHLELLREKGHFPCKDDAVEEITYLPGIPSINTRDLNYLKECEALTVIGKILTHAFGEVKKTDFVLQNTVEELEPEVLAALNGHQPNYAIGPLNFAEKFFSFSPIMKSVWAESDCTKWLESKPPGSVLYVSFGSFVHSNKELVDEIAHGLLLSEVNFVWVLRTGILSTGEPYNLPDEYQEKIAGKGLIIPWSNQIKVLSNPAVGGFLTHNGWNSTVESMWCGVPMICFPFAHDQVTTRKLVVDDLKVGVNLLPDGGRSIDRNQVAEKIKSFFRDGGGSDKLRDKASRVKEMMHTAFEVGGSSNRNFDQFLQDLKQKILSL